jgi:hypothetical protein
MGLIQVEGAGDYASLNAAIADASDGNTITISGSWSGDDTTDVSMNTTVTVNVTGTSQNNNGYPGRASGSYRLVKADAGADHVFTFSGDKSITINDMDIMSDSTGVSDEIFSVGDNDSDITCTRCHIGFSGNTDQQDIVYFTDDSVTVTWTFTSCMFYDVGRSIIDIYDVSGSTITVNFNSCSSFNIGANNSRNLGAWVGVDALGGTPTIVVNAFNCLIEYDIGSEIAFAVDSGPTATLNADYCISRGSSGSGKFYNAFDTVNVGNGNLYDYTWTADADPGSGDKVGLRDITTSPYDQRLTDHANNDAIDVHSVETGPDSGLALPSDILGTARGAAESHDIGAFEVAAAGGITLPLYAYYYNKKRTT